MMYFLKNKNSHGNEAPTKKKQTQLIPWKSSTLKDYDYNIPIAATVVSSVSIVIIIIISVIIIEHMCQVKSEGHRIQAQAFFLVDENTLVPLAVSSVS